MILYIGLYNITSNDIIAQGFTPHLIAERIGDTVQMLNNTYGHLYPNKHNEVAGKLNQIIVPN